jgi:hypothetical protein
MVLTIWSRIDSPTTSEKFRWYGTIDPKASPPELPPPTLKLIEAKRQ